MDSSWGLDFRARQKRPRGAPTAPKEGPGAAQEAPSPSGSQSLQRASRGPPEGFQRASRGPPEGLQRASRGPPESLPRGARPSLGLGNASQSRDPGGRRLGSTKIAANRAGPMIPYPPGIPLWDSEIRARAVILGVDVWGAPKSQKSKQINDSVPSCHPSLKYSQSRNPGGRRLGSTQIAEFQAD